MFDAIIVGGSYAGISAALQLVRARRSVLVLDSGSRRNRFASTAYGFLGHDGRAPGAIVADGREELLGYPTVKWVDVVAESARPSGRGFTVATANGESHEARRLILATGVVDELPDVPGLAERWGKGVYHCPYCHGYELGNGRIGVLATSEGSMHHALLLPDWGSTTFFLNDAFDPDADQRAQLHERGVAIETQRIERLTGSRADVELADGRVVPLDGLFTLTHTRMASPLAEQLGCAFEQGALGLCIETDAFKETTIPGVFACGDAARAAGNVPLAVGDGTLAGIGAHQSLIFREE